MGTGCTSGWRARAEHAVEGWGAGRRKCLCAGSMSVHWCRRMCWLRCAAMLLLLLLLQNVLLTREGRAKVCDFGIAKWKERTFVSTANGQAGTPAYMAPEIFAGSEARLTEKVGRHVLASLGTYLWAAAS